MTIVSHFLFIYFIPYNFMQCSIALTKGTFINQINAFYLFKVDKLLIKNN